MSSILKALQRVEQERPAGAAPSAPRRALRGDFVAEKGQPLLRRPQRPKASLRLWGGLGAILLLAGLVWWRLPAQGRAPVVAAAAPEAAQAERAAEPARGGAPAEPAAAPAPRSARARRAPAPPPGAEPAAAIAAQAEPAPAVPPDTEPAAAAPMPAAQPAVPVEIAERLPPLGTTLDVPEPAPARAPVQRAPAQEAPAPAPEPAPLEAAEPRSAPPAPAPAPEPARPAPAVVAKPAPPVVAKPAPPVVAKPAPPPTPSAPTVLVERTSWHPSAERRTAWVSVEGLGGTHELHEGEAVGALVVKEIRPSSVVFLHGAATLQRKVGQRE